MSIKLDLTDLERQKLRSAKIRIADLHLLRPDELAKAIQCTAERAKFLTGLATFQQIPSIGYRMAYNLVYFLNIYTLHEIKEYDPQELFDCIEQRVGERIDPCVEDQIRCVIYYANHPNSTKQWYDFTEQRKADRLA